MVSATPSGGWLQSSPVIPELGFCLGTRAQMFWLDDHHPAGLAPGKRAAHDIVADAGAARRRAVSRLGHTGRRSAGSVDHAVLSAPRARAANLQEAIDAPAWHSEHFPSSFWPRSARPGVLVAEGRLPRTTIAELKRRGHIVEVGPDSSRRPSPAAARDGRRRRAAANPRGMQGYAAGR